MAIVFLSISKYDKRNFSLSWGLLNNNYYSTQNSIFYKKYLLTINCVYQVLLYLVQNQPVNFLFVTTNSRRHKYRQHINSSFINPIHLRYDDCIVVTSVFYMLLLVQPFKFHRYWIYWQENTIWTNRYIFPRKTDEFMRNCECGTPVEQEDYVSQFPNTTAQCSSPIQASLAGNFNYYTSC